MNLNTTVMGKVNLHMFIMNEIHADLIQKNGWLS